ncbi:MAG: dihydrofolate reductase [Crocinitomicaceae bacterium]
MKVALIVAMDIERGIGKDNDLMWHLPEDMKFFKETTLGQVVVMGRKNYDSIPTKYRPLPKRENVILTRNKNYNAEKGCVAFNSIKECMDAYKAETERTVFIIGGGEIYKIALDEGYVDEMYITHVNDNYRPDTFFPDFDLAQWNVKTIKTYEKDEENEASFAVLKYTRK